MSKPKERKTLAELSAAAAQGGNGITCVKCGCRHFWKVSDTVKISDGVRRYRKCRNCGHIVVTTEKKGA